MGIGSVQKIVICEKVLDGSSTVSRSPCNTIPASLGVYQAKVVDAYLLDSTASIPAEVQQIDPAQASAVFAAGFVAVLGCFLFARGIGTVLHAIRKF